DAPSLNPTAGITVAAWVMPRSAATDFRSICVKNYSFYLYASVAAYCGAGSPFGGFSGPPAGSVCQPQPLPVGQWTHLAFTYDGNHLRLYRNRAEVAMAAVTATLT